MTVYFQTDDQGNWNDPFTYWTNAADSGLQVNGTKVVGIQLPAVTNSSTTTTGGLTAGLSTTMPANLVTNYNIATTLIGTLTGAVNTTNTHVNNLDTQVNATDALVNTMAAKINSLASDVAAVSDQLNIALNRLRTHGLIST